VGSKTRLMARLLRITVHLHCGNRVGDRVAGCAPVHLRSAACRDLAIGTVRSRRADGIARGPSKTLPVLERRLNEALTGDLPRGMRRRAWQVAIRLGTWFPITATAAAATKFVASQPKQDAQFMLNASACIVGVRAAFTPWP